MFSTPLCGKAAMRNGPACLKLPRMGYIKHESSCLLAYVLLHTLMYLATVSPCFLSIISWILVCFEDPVDQISMEEGAATAKCQESVATSGVMPGEQHPLISPWPAIEAPVDGASNIDYEQYQPPKELFLLLDKDETPPEIRNIVLSSINKPEKAVSDSEKPKTLEDPSANPEVVGIPQSSESSQVTRVASRPDQSHSRSVSTASLSLSTSRTTNGSDDGTRLGSKKATLSALLSSTTNLIGSVKQAIKNPSTAERHAVSETSQKVHKSS